MAGPWRVRFDVMALGQGHAVRTQRQQELGYVVWPLLFREPTGEQTAEPSTALGIPEGVYAICPVCGKAGTVWFADQHADHRAVWQWNGDRDKPTLTPSVLSFNQNCGMHVWVRDGQILDAGTPPHE